MDQKQKKEDTKKFSGRKENVNYATEIMQKRRNILYFNCNTYDTLKSKHDFKYTLENLFNEENLSMFGKYIADSFEMRTIELEKLRAGNTPECE